MSNVSHFPSPEPADVPWLDVLREATGYGLSTEQEARLIEAVEEIGTLDSIVMATAEALVSKWPGLHKGGKGHTRIDLTLRNWIRREVDRRIVRVAPRDVSPEVMRAYLERKRATAAYLRAHPEQDQRQG